MPNGIDGYISDKVIHSVDSINEALQMEASEARKNKDSGQSNIRGADYPADSYTDSKSKSARDDVSEVDIANNAWLAENGGNTRNILKTIEDIQMDDFLQRMRDGKSNYIDADETVDEGLLGGLQTPYELLAEIDIRMPSGLTDALWVLAPIPMMIGELVNLIKGLVTMDEETFVEDMMKMIALQTKLQERLGDILH